MTTKGYKYTDEQRKRMSEAHKKRHEERRRLGLKTNMVLSPQHERKLRAGHKRWALESPRVNEKHPLWKGDKAGYGAIHDWVRRRWTRTGICQKCGRSDRKTELANVNHRYRRVLRDWREWCRSCHRLHDYKKFGRKR